MDTYLHHRGYRRISYCRMFEAPVFCASGGDPNEKWSLIPFLIFSSDGGSDPVLLSISLFPRTHRRILEAPVTCYHLIANVRLSLSDLHPRLGHNTMLQFRPRVVVRHHLGAGEITAYLRIGPSHLTTRTVPCRNISCAKVLEAHAKHRGRLKEGEGLARYGPAMLMASAPWLTMQYWSADVVRLHTVAEGGERGRYMLL